MQDNLNTDQYETDRLHEWLRETAEGIEDVPEIDLFDLADMKYEYERDNQKS